jgi:hypothetical protein
MQAAQLKPAQTLARASEVLCNLPGARVAANRLAHMGYTVTRVDVDRNGSACAVCTNEATQPQAKPDLQALIDCCAWLLEHGYYADAAVWRANKQPLVRIAAPAGCAELDAVVVASEHLLGGRTVITWCAIRFGCEIRWEEIV